MELRFGDVARPVGPAIPWNTPAAEAARLADRDVVVPVTDPAGRPFAVVDPEALFRSMAAGAGDEPVERFAARAQLVAAEDPLDAAAHWGHFLVADEAGQAVGYLSRERMLETLVRRLGFQLERMRVALDAAYNAIVVVNAEAVIVAGNRALGRVLGTLVADLLGRRIQDVVPHTGLLAVLRTGQAHIGTRIEIGGHTYLSNRTPIVQDGRVVGAVAVLQDVTDLEAARAERDEATRLKNVLETVLDSAYEGIVVVDERGVITMFNRAYGEFLGVEPEEMVGRPVIEAIENTRMHIVVRSGRAELRRVQRIKGHDMVCDRIPIREGDRVVGAVGKVLFRDVSELDALAQETRRLRNELEFYKGELRRQNGTRYSLESIVGDSPALLALKKTTRQVARSQSTVLLEGESGTGKELFAHAIHNLSPRADGPFVKVNCAAIPEALLESELFGYRDGAFTGARKGGKVGKFELAQGGTVFLDEVGELPLPMQAKLLRVLQEREIERLGGTRPVRVDVRVIAATNRRLRTLVEAGQFRSDLLYRLNVVSLEVPPLRERREDIPVLVEHLMEKLCQQIGCAPKRLDPRTWGHLVGYPWPGNVRELENALERALNLAEGKEILPAHLPLVVRSAAARSAGLPTLRQVVEEAEAEHLRRALRATGGNAVEAARLLGIGKSSFYEKAARYSLLARRPKDRPGRP
ncbi:MAG: sigma-54-dependent Fis family transcriptional regulator [Deferrisomatales bacterium]